MRFQAIFRQTTACACAAFLIVSSSCGRATYPKEKVAAGIKEICEKEYNVQNVEVKFNGETIGVFLPLKKLFTSDIKKALLSGNAANFQSLFEPSPEAMEQVEDVFFAISRVLLSSDEEIEFYVLEATDVESTGLQLVLSGYVPDVRRVRLWDISRSEYRKRVLHELKHNRAVIWHKTIRQMFQKAPTSNAKELTELYFTAPPEPESVSSLFHHFLTTLEQKQNLKVEIEDIRSHALGENQALVYAKLKETYEPKPLPSKSDFLYPSGAELEYIFALTPANDQFKIARVIPLSYVENGQVKRTAFPPQLGLEENLASWPSDFDVEDIQLGEFLTRQLNRRVQELLVSDERVRHTLSQARFNFTYYHRPEDLQEASKPYFALHFDFQPKGVKSGLQGAEQAVQDDDILYVLDLALREFVDLARSYRFDEYGHFDLISDTAGLSYRLLLKVENLELFRKRKMDISGLLQAPLSSAPHSLF